MRLSGRLQAAIDVLEDIEQRRRPAADSLRDWGLAHRFAGSGDRAAIGSLVYDALRRKRSLGWRMDEDIPIAFAYGALFEILQAGHEEIASLMTQMAGDPFAPPPLNAASITAWCTRNIGDAADEVQADLALWCCQDFKNLYGEAWVEQAQALAKRAPIDLRLNSLKTAPPQVAKQLSAYHAHPIAWFDKAWRLEPTVGFERHPNIQASGAFQKGWFEIQDLGSQIVAHLAGAQPHLQLLDYCAGGGGKTLALADMMNNHGQIYAYDHDRTRLAPIFARLKRAGVRNVQVLEQEQDLNRLIGKMDLLLLDAPCSGSGTWRRHPDAKWRLRASQLERRVEEQRFLLEKTWHFIKPGGRLVYITCSLFAAENNLQIINFLKQRPEFSALDMRKIWDLHMPNSAYKPHFANIGLTLSPASTNSDGFYIAILERCI